MRNVPNISAERLWTMAKKPDEWEGRMRRIAQDVCREMMATLPNVVNVPNGEERPPEPRAINRRKENRIYGKLGATVDAVLFNRLVAEAEQRGVSVGKLLDLILWHRYERPLMSHELPDDEQRRLRAGVTRKKRGSGDSTGGSEE
jgi:hypothetical protein